jgi:hypothetical protein
MKNLQGDLGCCLVDVAVVTVLGRRRVFSDGGVTLSTRVAIRVRLETVRK